MATCLKLILILTLTKAHAGLNLELIEETYRQCHPNQVCIAQESCPSFKEGMAQLKSPSIKIQEYNEIIGQLEEKACNKEKQASCCVVGRSVVGGGNRCCR